VTSREERDRRRQERLEAEKRSKAAERRRMILGYGVAGALSLAVVVGVVIVVASSGDGSDQVSGEDLPAAAHIEVQTGFLNDAEPDDREGTQPPEVQRGDLRAAAKEANCELRLDLPDEGNNHLRGNDDPPEWDTNPPTSGDHSPQQQADGAYVEVDEVNTLHALEHGRINIQYSPDLPEADQLELKGVFDEDPAGMLFFADPDMPYEVAATGWRQLLGCPKYEGRVTLDAVRAFRATYRGRGPEPFAITVPG
jgi:hypothetical protein